MATRKRGTPPSSLGEKPAPAPDSNAEEEIAELPRDPALPFMVVCIGASAGGLEAFTQLLSALPSDTGMAFVLVSHLSPSHPSHLAEILSRSTKMPVMEVKDEPAVQPNHVYVIPPDRNMIISRATLKLLPRREVHGQYHPIDVFLESLATDQGHRSSAVVLSGTGSDGTLGLGVIKAEGGITFAQDETATYEGMPRSAISTGAVDFVLPPAGIARELVQIGERARQAPAERDLIEPTEAASFTQILQHLDRATGVDFSQYKFTTLFRRISRRLLLHKLDTLKDYAQHLRGSPGEVNALFQDILINVTSFFRDPETFELLKTRVFPRFTPEHAGGETVRMWVVGCSTGEEAYSIAISFNEFMEREGRAWPVQIFATDLNGESVERARAGMYPKSISERVTSERLRRYFYEVDGRYRVAKSIREMVTFAKHNSLVDPPFSRMDLITCRNLLIYLDGPAQQRLMPILHYALKPNGLLWLGSSETTGPARELFNAEDAKHRFYVKKANGTKLPLPLQVRQAPSGAGAGLSELQDVPDGRPEDVQREADRILLGRFTPPAVLVNADLEILQFRGDTGAYLTPAPGRATLNVLKMAREGLLEPIRDALARSRKERVTSRMEGVRVRTTGGYHRVDLDVVPVRGSGARGECFLIVFHERDEPPVAEQTSVAAAFSSELDRETVLLKQELASTREYLQSVIEQQDAANEELQSANEEVQSANEELQSINEEIETSKEEMQSTNEELATVNDELQTRNAELGESNNDLTNLLASVQMAIVMLGSDLRIRRFTPMAEKMLNLIATDLGRPITDIKLNVDVPDLDQILIDVVETVQAHQREVQDRAGRWYSLRVRPYRTLDNRIDGAVIVLVDIDSLKRATDSLRSSEERLRITYDRAPLGIFETDLDGRFVRVNDKFCELTGRTREALLKLRSEDITHPDDVAVHREDVERVKSGAVPSVRREKRYVREDGQVTWVELHRFAITDATGEQTFTVGIAEDIAERKETELALRRREARFRSLMDSAPALIWVNGVEGMEYVNQAYLEFLGVESHDVVGNAWLYFVHPEDRDAYTSAYEAATGGLQPFEHQFRFRRRDGEYRSMMSVALPQFGAAGKFSGYTGATFDITSLKQAEESLRIADQRKDEFIAMLAHELRNPLGPISNVVQMLKSPGLDAKTLDWAHAVLERQLRNVSRMVNDLLDVSRVSHGKIQLHREHVDLAELIERSVDALRPTIQAGGKQVMMEIPSDPVVTFADPVRLEQVVGNLVHNAVKFTPQNGHIWINTDVAPGGEEVIVTVRDDGDGIPVDILPRVFDLFTQGNTSLDRAQGGLGIGLTLVRGLVELHGGNIEARSKGPGQGSEFTIRLPLVEVPASDRAGVPVPPSGPQRILIVDDNVDAATALAALLRQDGHTVAVRHTGVSALEAAAVSSPQIALLDLGMPGMNGYEVAQRLRVVNRNVLLIAISGYSGEESRRRARESGFDDYVIKPFDPQTLSAILHRHKR